MSFLAGRLAATEGAYFLRESKVAVSRLAQKLPPPPAATLKSPAEESADVLPEILRHSFPLKGSVHAPPEFDPSLSTASKWILHVGSPSSHAGASPDVLNPLRAYVSFPQATFGPKRWQLPNEQPTVSASTANDLRHDRYARVDSEKLKALAVGYVQIGKAFIVATSIIFGGATIAFAYMAHKLEMSSSDDIKTKGRDLIQPGADIMREQLIPLRAWAENLERKWHIERSREDKSIAKELSKTLRMRTSN